MKRISVLMNIKVLIFLLIAGAVHAEGPYYHTLGTRLNLPANLGLDTLGRIVYPDSITVFVKRQDALTPTAYRRWTSLAAACTPTGTLPTGAGWFDTVTTTSETYGSLTMNVWSDSLGPVGYTYNVDIRSWYKQGSVAAQPFPRMHTVVLTSTDMITQLANKLDSAIVRRMADSSIRTLTITADSLMKLINVYQGLNICAIGNGSTTTSVVTTLTQSTTDFWKYKSLCMIRGTLAGQTREITAYNGTTKTFTTTAFTSAPSSGDTGILIPGAASGTTSGNVTVGGYASGQDPATLILGAASSSWNTLNTIGYLLNYAGTASNWLGRSDLGISTDTVNDASASTTQFIGKVSVTGTDFWKDKAIVMTSGTLALCTRRVTAYNYATKTYTVDAFPSAPANGVTFILVPVGSSQSIASVTVNGYTSGNAPEERLLTTPTNKLATDASGRVNVGSWRDVSVAAPMTGGYPKVDIYAQRGFGPLPTPTLSGGDYIPDVYNLRNNVLGNLNGTIGGIAPNGISEQSYQTGALSARVINPLAFDSGSFTNAFIDKLIDRLFSSDTTTHTPTWFAAKKMGGLMSQTGAQTIDSGVVARIVWGIVTGIKKTANNTDTSTVAQRTVSGLSVTIDSAQISRIVKRVVWGIASGSGSDSTTAAQRVISFDQQSLVNAVWNELKAGHSTAGTFGYLLDARVSSVSGASGNGAYSWDVYLVDTSATPDSVINNAQVWVTNSAQNTQPYFALTDNTGKAHFQINAGTWVTFTTEPGFAQAVRAFSMSASGVDTLKLYRGNTGRSTLAFYNAKSAGLTYASASVTIELVSVHDSLLMVGDTVIASNGKGYVTAYTNNQGQATIPLYPNSVFTNDSTYYRATVKDNKRGTVVDQFRFRMPAGFATVWLKDVTRWRDR